MKWLARKFLKAITGRDMLAVTLLRGVFLLYPESELRERLGAEGFEELMAHEAWHVIQQTREGIRFYSRYALEHIRHGYLMNRYELEAREMARDTIRARREAGR